MRTDRDFAKACTLFLSAFLIGGVLFALMSCRAIDGAGRDLHDASKWLPEPYGTLTDIAGTALVMFAGHKGVKHIAKRRAHHLAAKPA